MQVDDLWESIITRINSLAATFTPSDVASLLEVATAVESLLFDRIMILGIDESKLLDPLSRVLSRLKEDAAFVRQGNHLYMLYERVYSLVKQLVTYPRTVNGMRVDAANLLLSELERLAHSAQRFELDDDSSGIHFMPCLDPLNCTHTHTHPIN